MKNIIIAIVVAAAIAMSSCGTLGAGDWERRVDSNTVLKQNSFGVYYQEQCVPDTNGNPIIVRTVLGR